MKTILQLVVACLLSQVISAQTINNNTVPGVPNTWTQKADFAGGNREYMARFTIGSKAFVGCGNDGVNQFKDFWEYDPATDKWTRKADFPGAARSAAVGFSIGNKGYLGSGSGNYYGPYFNDFYEYNPATDSWTRIADFPGVARFGGAAFSIGSKGYFGSGVTTSSGDIFYNDFWEYDPATNKWTRKADCAGGGRNGSGSFSIGNKGYVGCGFNWSYGGNTKDFWEYDPATDKWTRKADFGGSAREYNGQIGFSIGDKGYIGTGEGGGLNRDFWEYNPVINKWTRMADVGGNGRCRSVGFSIGNKGYIGTGWQGNKDFWEYTPECAGGITVYADTDGDGFGDVANSLFVTDCILPGGYVYNSTDCNDANAAIHPGACDAKNGDGIDNNCDGVIDDGYGATTYFKDADGDGYGAGTGTSLCNNPGVGYSKNNKDCNDNNNAINPGALEIIGDGVDNNCNGIIDGDLPNYIPIDGLVAWYPFNGNAYDESDNGNNGMVNGASLAIDRFGKVDRAYSFNGSGNNITVFDNNSLRIESGEYSISLWIDATDIQQQNLLLKGNPNLSQDGFSITMNRFANDITLTKNAVTDQPVSYSFFANKWYHLVCVQKSKTVYYYINGSLVGTYQNTQQYFVSTKNLIIGNGDTYFSHKFNGLIDDIGIWNRALTHEEITNLYNTICIGLTFYADEDGDNYGDVAKRYFATDCIKPTGYVLDSTDCNDANPSINPGAPEICGNRIDDNCNGTIDEGCIVITNVTNINSSQATIHWKAVPNASSFRLRSYPAGTTHYKYYGYETPVTDTFKTITNLFQVTQYNVQVMALFAGGTDSSDWSAPYTFTTQGYCNPPTGLQVGTVTSTSAKLLWSSPLYAVSHYELRIRRNGAPEWTVRPIQPATESITINGLRPGTQYQWQLRSGCINITDKSNWAKGPLFTTTGTAVTANSSASLTAGNSAATLLVSPNPNKGQFTIHALLPGKAAPTTVTLYNNLGAKVWQYIAGSISGQWHSTVELEHKLTPGMYTLMLQRSDIKLVQKILISK